MIPHPTVVYTILAGLSFLSNTGQYYAVGTVYAAAIQSTFDHQDYPLGAAYAGHGFSGKGVLLHPGCNHFPYPTTIASYLLLPYPGTKCWFHENPDCPAPSDKGPNPLWDQDVDLSQQFTQGKNVANSAYCWRPALDLPIFPVGVVFTEHNYYGSSDIMGVGMCNKFKIAGVSSYLLLPNLGATCEFRDTDTCPQNTPLWIAEDRSDGTLKGDHDNRAKSAYCSRK